MIILWYSDFHGSDEELAKVNRIFKEITDEIGGSVDGSYLPQKESLLHIAKVSSYDWLNKCGRIFLKRIKEEGINIKPVKYEVAVSPEEFGGK